MQGRSLPEVLWVVEGTGQVLKVSDLLPPVQVEGLCFIFIITIILSNSN